MSNAGNRDDHPQNCVRVTVSIEPMANVEDALVGLLGCFAFDLSEALGYSPQIGTEANVLIVEETLNVLERSVHSTGEIKLDATLTSDNVQVQCSVRPRSNAAKPEADDWFPPDEPGATRENPAMQTMSRKRSELQKMVQDLRVDRAKGGLGLTRLATESKAHREAENENRGDGSGNEGSASGTSAAVIPLRKKPK